MLHLCALVLSFAAWTPSAAASDSRVEPHTIRFGSALALPPVTLGGRAAVLVDPIEAAIAYGRFSAPKAGDRVRRADGEDVEWFPIEADESGRFRHRALRGGYLFATVEVEQEGAFVLVARGHRHVRVNGDPRGGDVYDQGILRLPVWLRAGTNEFLFRGGRGSIQAALERPEAAVYLDEADPVLPDLLQGEHEPLLGSVVVGNATREWVSGLDLVASRGPLSRARRVPPIPPLSVRKVEFQVVPAGDASHPETSLEVELARGFARTIDRAAFTLRVRDPREKHVRTFRSAIDGSVQYYAVTPPKRPTAGAPGLILTLHGAGVQATNQAFAYAPKDGAWVVAPTNRRPFGFDWEDWGRLDALEVLLEASVRFGADPARTWLTGHSMGGHGTWNLGASRPDLFAAIAPSAGWRDFWSYGGAFAAEEPSPIQAMLMRAANPSRTLLLLPNLDGIGVYVLHGDRDDNVPVSQARFMREQLGGFHRDFAYYERPGAGHWWGNACMDWPPLIDFLMARAAPAHVDETTLRLVHPSITSRRDFVRVVQQRRWMEPSRIHARRLSEPFAFEIETDNVGAFEIDLSGFDAVPDPISVRVDGVDLAFERPADRVLRIESGPEGFRRVPGFDRNDKRPGRAGPLKEAFQNRMVFVAGTGGDDAADRWALAKARFDAETFQYRGNGSVQILTDAQFLSGGDPGGNAILYGNADENLAFGALVDAEVVPKRGRIELGGRAFVGDDLGALFVRPRKDAQDAQVAVLCGTGPAGRRAIEMLPLFVSGAGFPDCLVVEATVLERGSEGVAAAGFFGSDWSVEGGDFAFSADSRKHAETR